MIITSEYLFVVLCLIFILCGYGYQRETDYGKTGDFWFKRVGGILIYLFPGFLGRGSLFCELGFATRNETLVVGSSHLTTLIPFSPLGSK